MLARPGLGCSATCIILQIQTIPTISRPQYLKEECKNSQAVICSLLYSLLDITVTSLVMDQVQLHGEGVVPQPVLGPLAVGLSPVKVELG